MDIIRKHLFFILCGVIGLAGIGLGAWGITSMSAVDTRMDDAVTLYGQLQRTQAVNREGIAAQAARVERVKRNYDEVIKLSDEYAGHKQLVENFFPNPVYEARFDFPRVYRAALDGLYQRLRAGSLPTDAEVRDAEERIRDEQRARENAAFGLDPNEAAVQSGGQPEPVEAYRPSGLITTEQARTDPFVRASITKARRIYCYANPPGGEDSTLDIIPSVYDPGGYAPAVGDCWDAQLQLWVQQDVVEALARVNEAAADQLPPEDRWVGHLPVKRVIQLRVNPRYVGTPTGPTQEAFTGNTSNAEYEVLYFTAHLVVDARDLNAIIAEICNNSYTTLYRIDYRAEPPNLEMEGYIYGGEPVVNVMMDFEKILYSKLYLPLMPDIVLTDLGKQRPEPEPEPQPAVGP